jgi:hypothetical protein
VKIKPVGIASMIGSGEVSLGETHIRPPNTPTIHDHPGTYPGTTRTLDILEIRDILQLLASPTGFEPVLPP